MTTTKKKKTSKKATKKQEPLETKTKRNQVGIEEFYDAMSLLRGVSVVAYDIESRMEQLTAANKALTNNIMTLTFAFTVQIVVICWFAL